VVIVLLPLMTVQLSIHAQVVRYDAMTVLAANQSTFAQLVKNMKVSQDRLPSALKVTHSDAPLELV
jgi:hypothetical protein